MFYTLTKYLTSDYFRENEFTKAFLELVDEVIFCCYMESREMLSQLSFETMDDNYFLTFQDFFLNGLSSFDIKNLDRNVLSEWFSLLHVRGELSDLSKLLKFGGSLTTIQTNNKLTLYNNADVPETITNIGVDGVIYAVTDENVNLTEDFFINQQTPAGYKFNLIRQSAPFDLVSSDSIDYLLEKNNNIFVIDYGSIDLTKEKSSEFEFYRRRQFDQTYSFKQLYQSGYTINELSKFHKKGDFFFGFDIELIEPEPPVITGIPMGGMMSPTGHSTYYVQELPEQITVDNITLSGFIVPMSVEDTVYGNPNVISQSIVINDNDVNGILYDADGEPITNMSKLYSVKSISGTGSGSIPVSVEENGWFTTNGDAETSNTAYSGTHILYDDSGNMLYYDSTKTYHLIKAFVRVSGQLVEQDITGCYITEQDSSIHTLGMFSNEARNYIKIIYSISGSQSFNNLDTLRQMGFVSTYFDSQGRLRLKFACAGTGITFTGSMDSALIIAAIKQQMTVDNIGLQGMVSPMGGMMVKDYDYDFIVWSNGGLKFGVNELEPLIFVESLSLPTVSVINGIVGSDSAYGTRNIPNGSSVYQWANNGGWALVTVASGNVIAFQRIANSSNDNVKYSGFDAQITQDGYVRVTNNTGSSYSGAFYLVTAVCSSSSATVITVYDSSNTPHNAFKYTSDGTDYYYVLDGTQTDWTDDLSGIGYSLTIHAFTAWLSADKSPGMYTGFWHVLFDDNGNYILLPGVAAERLSVVDWYDENNVLVEFPPSITDKGSLVTSVYSDGRLMFMASSWPYPYTAPAMLTRITYVIN